MEKIVLEWIFSVDLRNEMKKALIFSLYFNNFVLYSEKILSTLYG